MARVSKYHEGRKLAGDRIGNEKNYVNDVADFYEPDDDDDGEPVSVNYVQYGEDHASWRRVIVIWHESTAAQFVHVPNRYCKVLCTKQRYSYKQMARVDSSG